MYPNASSPYILTDADIATVLSEATIDGAKPNISIIASGNYVGNNTVNRAIPHGLGAAPKINLYTRVNGVYYACFGASIDYTSYSVSSNNAVTPTDATNFYVGNASEYNESANSNGVTYYWVVSA